jgi:hypothetical protein
MPHPTHMAPLSGCVTVDASPYDYLNNVRAGTPAAGRHHDTQSAVASLLNLAKASSSRTTASIVGYGLRGRIFTGDAFDISEPPDEHIGLGNRSVWAPLLQPLKGRFTELHLYASGVGAGNEGAELLYALAQTIDADVRAPSGLLVCDRHGLFKLQSGEVWRTASPSLRPGPLPAPAPMGDTSTISTCVAFDAMNMPLPPEFAFALARQVLWDQSFHALGEPGTKITGRLRVAFTGSPMRTFTILDRAIVREDARSTHFYPVTSGFRAIALRL